MFVQGISLIISGAVYAFNPSYTPWHAQVIGNDPLPSGAVRVLFSLYRCVGWSVIACGLSTILLTYLRLLTRDCANYDAKHDRIVWLVIFFLSFTPAFASLVVSFQVGWNACPWYMPALGCLLACVGAIVSFPKLSHKLKKI